MTDDVNDTAFAKILQLVQQDAGVDFSHYKMATIKRRVSRRMLVHQLDTQKEYAELLSGNNEEITLLYHDMLIHVTDFFRDTETHKYLKQQLLPKLLSVKADGETLRIWIPACATGEEAYSIAICVLEIINTKSLHTPVQIFATDLSVAAIKKARAAEYSAQSVASISPRRLKHYFTKSGDKYRIAKVVRDICVFAPHNVLTDPPFSHVDLISCCNMLIYLDTPAQKKVMSTFHYALNPGGYLVLGKSETTGESTNQFVQPNAKYKIYLRKTIVGVQTVPLFVRSLKNKAIAPGNGHATQHDQKSIIENGFGASVDQLLLTRYIPASVVINQNFDIVQFRGATDLYLKHPTGKATLNLLKMTSPEISFEIRAAVAKTIKSGIVTNKENIEIKKGSGYRLVNIEIVPLMYDLDEPLLLVIFTEPEKNTVYNQPGENAKRDSIKDKRIRILEDNLSAAHQNMLSFVGEQEKFTQELQSANEEVVSSNEELQSLNEELETSKEEIESSNEELITSNQELINRNELLQESYSYSEAIVNTMHEPMLVLDKEFRVKSANNAFYKFFITKKEEVIDSRLHELGNKQWAIPRLRRLLNDTISSNTLVHDFEVRHTFPGIGEKTMLLNASPIIQKTKGGQLIMLAFNDITDRTQLQRQQTDRLINVVKENEVQKEKLEISVTERTKELAHSNKLLEENIQDLEKINDELQAFAFVSSHDLQEPLRKIQTYAGLILANDHTNLSARGKENFGKIQEAAKRMRTLIQDLIAYSKLNVGEREFEKTNPAVIIAEVLSELDSDIKEKNAKVEVNVKCYIHIIPFQFRQLIYNLLSNALKFSKPDQHPHIKISSKIVETEKLNAYQKDISLHSCCLISIVDNGIGFDKAYAEKIFNVFQKLHTREEFEGTGIGLAIVKKIVENHNGFIEASSKERKGARFDIYFPV